MASEVLTSSRSSTGSSVSAECLTPRRGKSSLARFLLQFKNPLIYILLAAAAITAVLKDMTDAIIIFLVVLINAVIGYFRKRAPRRQWKHWPNA